MAAFFVCSLLVIRHPRVYRTTGSKIFQSWLHKVCFALKNMFRVKKGSLYCKKWPKISKALDFVIFLVTFVAWNNLRIFRRNSNEK